MYNYKNMYMEILFKLPLPDELCWKIIYYACKSNLHDLGLGVVKHFTYSENNNNCLSSVKSDKMLIEFFRSSCPFINYMKPFNIFKLGMFTNMQKLIICPFASDMFEAITGAIQVVRNMPNLTNIVISFSNIYGNICNLSSLTKLENLSLTKVNIEGNISSLLSLQHLKSLFIANTLVHGNKDIFKNINNLKYFIEI